jgi:hypothetical protein
MGAAGCRDHTPTAEHQAAPAATPPDPATGAPPPEAPGAADMKAYVDPETGKLTDKPPPGAEPLPGDVTPPPTVIERPAPGGGQVLDMRGQHKNADTDPVP